MTKPFRSFTCDRFAKLRCSAKGNGRNFYDLVSKSNAFRVILLEPLIGSFRGCEHLEMIGMTDIMVSVDVNPNCFHWSLLSFRFPQCVSLREVARKRYPGSPWCQRTQKMSASRGRPEVTGQG